MPTSYGLLAGTTLGTLAAPRSGDLSCLCAVLSSRSGSPPIAPAVAPNCGSQTASSQSHTASSPLPCEATGTAASPTAPLRLSHQARLPPQLAAG